MLPENQPPGRGKNKTGRGRKEADLLRFWQSPISWAPNVGFTSVNLECWEGQGLLSSQVFPRFPAHVEFSKKPEIQLTDGLKKKKRFKMQIRSNEGVNRIWNVLVQVWRAGTGFYFGFWWSVQPSFIAWKFHNRRNFLVVNAVSPLPALIVEEMQLECARCCTTKQEGAKKGSDKVCSWWDSI